MWWYRVGNVDSTVYLCPYSRISIQFEYKINNINYRFVDDIGSFADLRLIYTRTAVASELKVITNIFSHIPLRSQRFTREKNVWG